MAETPGGALQRSSHHSHLDQKKSVVVLLLAWGGCGRCAAADGDMGEATAWGERGSWRLRPARRWYRLRGGDITGSLERRLGEATAG